MATLIEEREEELILEDDQELGSFEDTEATPIAEADKPADNTPAKYVGKSQAELIAMHQEAERFAGKQSSEVGDLRRSVDQLIQAQLKPVAAPAVEEAPIDLFEDPDRYMDHKIRNHPDIVAVRDATANAKKQTASQALHAKHPDMGTLLQDEAFLVWVGGSNIRTRLFQSANKDYDFDAADELFSNWKERQGIKAQTLEVEKRERKQQVAAANTGNAPASQAGSRKKMYRRSDIIRLMNDDPDRYLSLSNELMAAYAEGRVVN